MAKCPICNTRKGKRKCGIVNNDFVCSLCCASTRKQELCLDCVYYQPPQHNYDEVPAFSATVLANNHALHHYQDLIETALNADTEENKIAMIELLINKYHFKETEIKVGNSLWQTGFEAADNIIQNELTDVDEETLINLLGTIRCSIREKITQE